MGRALRRIHQLCAHRQRTAAHGPDVLRPRSEVDQDSVLLEGGHLVADDFLGIGRSVADRFPHFFKYGLHVGGELRDVTVDVFRSWWFWHLSILGITVHFFSQQGFTSRLSDPLRSEPPGEFAAVGAFAAPDTRFRSAYSEMHGCATRTRRFPIYRRLNSHWHGGLECRVAHELEHQRQPSLAPAP